MCFQQCGKVHASATSFNNHWGVPLTLARMPQDTDYGVFEIGMNHPGEIRPLVKMVRPHVAIITIIAAAHLGHFKNLDEIALAKAEIFEGVVRGRLRVLNRDDPRYRMLELKAKHCGRSKHLRVWRACAVQIQAGEIQADGGLLGDHRADQWH